MGRKTPRVGVIAEDDSDVDSVRILIQRMTGIAQISIKRRVGKGCGRLKKKCHAWTDLLRQQGCSLLILIHDLDSNNLSDLTKEIQKALNPCPIMIHLICIPVQEFEAWLLSDPMAIKDAMNLKNPPKVKTSPETINSPKEHLGELIYRASNKEQIYMNTKHNPKIAAKISIDLVRAKCQSFVPFYDFVHSHLDN